MTEETNKERVDKLDHLDLLVDVYTHLEMLRYALQKYINECREDLRKMDLDDSPVEKRKKIHIIC